MRRLVLLNMLLFALSVGLMGQTRLGVYAAGFYNLENLFDTEDDPNNPGDDEFLPNGPYAWDAGEISAETEEYGESHS